MELITETICPCKGCDERTVTCHGTCEKYLAWRKDLDEKNRKICEAKRVLEESHLMKQHWKNLRRKV